MNHPARCRPFCIQVEIKYLRDSGPAVGALRVSPPSGGLFCLGWPDLELLAEAGPCLIEISKNFYSAFARLLFLPSCSYPCSSNRLLVPELTRSAGIQLN
jgi:hypothetical protein